MDLREIFELLREPELKPRYNIAPTQSVALIRPAPGGRDLTLMHWGLIPSWSKDPKMGARMINARAESVATKPAFRSAFKQRIAAALLASSQKDQSLTAQAVLASGPVQF